MLRGVKLERLNSLILREITIILSREYPKSNFLSKISIHEVKTSNELSQTKIYFSVIGNMEDINIDEVQKEIDKQTNSIRYKLSKKLTTFKTPKLIFVYDECIDGGNKIENIIKSLHNPDSKT